MPENPIAKTLAACLISPNVADANAEPANIVDALAMIAGAIQELAAAVRNVKTVSIREMLRRQEQSESDRPG